MTDYQLPEFEPVPETNCGPTQNLQQFFKEHALAQWVPEWFEQLDQRFGKGFSTQIFTQPLEWMGPQAPDPVWLRGFLTTTDYARQWLSSLRHTPEWLWRLLRDEANGVARSFLLSGNISDYALDPVWGYRHAVRLLVDHLSRVKDCVITCRLSRGLTLYSKDPHIRKRLPENILEIIDSAGFISGVPLSDGICQVFDVLDKWLSNAELLKGVAIIFENVNLLIPQGSDLERSFLIDHFLRWSSSPEFFRSAHCLIMMAESLDDVCNELRAQGGRIEQITISRPRDPQARLQFIIPLLDPRSGMLETRAVHLTSGLSRLDGYQGSYAQRLRQLAHDTSGLNFIGIEDLVQAAMAEPDKNLTRTMVMRLKRARLRQESEGLLELLDPKHNLADIGGYEPIKNRLGDVARALKNSSDPLVRTTVPMGILLLGPPGTGKSMLAEALAAETSINMAKLGDFRGKYVGQSEANLSRIFSLIKALHPVIIFIDEIDQALGKRGSSEGGVDSRIFGRFLEFMSAPDNRGRILWIGAGNFPEKIDPAFKRPGRFDLVLPILLPDKTSRRAIFEIMLEQAVQFINGPRHNLSPDDYEQLADLTTGFSGAEIRAVSGEVLRRAAVHKTMMIDRLKIEEVLKVYQPPPQLRKKYRDMEAAAIEDVSFTDLLPEKYRPKG